MNITPPIVRTFSNIANAITHAAIFCCRKVGIIKSENVKNNIPDSRYTNILVPRQFGKNCIPNSIVAMMLELRTTHDFYIPDKVINKYRWPFSLSRQSNKMINKACNEVKVNCNFIYDPGSLVESLRNNDVVFAIAVNIHTHHAFPIKRVVENGESKYFTINQNGTFLSAPNYTGLVDDKDVQYYKIETDSNAVPTPDDFSTFSVTPASESENFLPGGDWGLISLADE